MHLKKTNSRPASIWDVLTYRTYNNTENVKILGNRQENPRLYYGKFITAATDSKELLSTVRAQQYYSLICQSTSHENSVKEKNGLATKSWSIEFLQEKTSCSVHLCACTSHMKLRLTKLWITTIHTFKRTSCHIDRDSKTAKNVNIWSDRQILFCPHESFLSY